MNIRPNQLSRRQMLHRCGAGFGAVALADMLWHSGFAGKSQAEDARAEPTLKPRAKRVIHLFMGGGPSHVDTFDPKPALKTRAGQDLPGRDKIELGQGGTSSILFPSPFQFSPHGESGLEISEIFPHLARHADRLC